MIAVKSLPSRAPGFEEGPRDSAAIEQISQTLSDPAVKNVKVVASGADVGAAIRSSLLKPDVALNPATPEVGFVHRKLPWCGHLFCGQHR